MNIKIVNDFIKNIFKDLDLIHFHAPNHDGNEKKYLNNCIDSVFLSSLGVYVDAFFKSEGKYNYILNLLALKHIRSKKDLFTLIIIIDVNVCNTYKSQTHLE